MQNRIRDIAESQDKREVGVQPIGEILEELLAQYARRFPDIHIAVVETSAAV